MAGEKPVFEIGEVVSHRATKQLGVVVGMELECLTHEDATFECYRGVPEPCYMSYTNKSKCKFQRTGVYFLDTGFGVENTEVQDVVLERVHKSAGVWPRADTADM